jgi:hypothetical protein
MGDELKFTNTTLNYLWNEKNPWFSALESYSDCYKRYYQTFNTLDDLEKEFKRSDINTVCKRELENLRKEAPTIHYKEIMGRVPTLLKDFEY